MRTFVRFLFKNHVNNLHVFIQGGDNSAAAAPPPLLEDALLTQHHGESADSDPLYLQLLLLFLNLRADARGLGAKKYVSESSSAHMS